MIDAANFGEGRYELLVRARAGWTPAGRYRTRRHCVLAALRARAGQFLIEDHRDRRGSGPRTSSKTGDRS